MSIDFVVATPHDAVHFNDVHRNYTATAGYLVCNNIYNRMVLTEWYNFDGSYPDLATHWEMLDGARVGQWPDLLPRIPGRNCRSRRS